MSAPKEVDVGSIVHFWFAANLTTGAAGDGATPTFAVRLAGAAAAAAPTATGTPILLTNAGYSDGSYEIAIDSTGYTVGSEYAVFCSLTISAVNPNGFVGSFIVRAAASSAYEYLTTVLGRIVGTLDTGTHKPQSGDTFTRWTTALTEAYAAKGAAPTPAQILFEIRGLLAELSQVTTTLTVKGIDGATAKETFTIDDASAPTSITRAT